MNLLKTLIPWSLLFLSCLSFAQDKIGGGGDASEIRVNEIRSDILKWINDGGSKGLLFNNGISLEEYNQTMKNILYPKKVVIGFIINDSDTNEELQVNVDGSPKTCRSFISKKTKLPHILCNIARFEKTAEANQYRLIHHEFAGLVGLERNDGAASDYYLSEQLTNYLTQTIVLRLGLKKPGSNSEQPAVLRYACTATLNDNPNDRHNGSLHAEIKYNSALQEGSVRIKGFDFFMYPTSNGVLVLEIASTRDEAQRARTYTYQPNENQTFTQFSFRLLDAQVQISCEFNN